MLRVQTMGDARVARSEMKGAMSGEKQAIGATLERIANTGSPWPMQTHILALNIVDLTQLANTGEIVRRPDSRR